MKLVARVLIAFALSLGSPSMQQAIARDADTERSLDQLRQEVRSLTDQVRQLRDDLRALAARGSVVLIDVPRDLSPAKADALCHQLGGAVRLFLPNAEPAPAAGRLLCRF